jgi:hypothetical protein
MLWKNHIAITPVNFVVAVVFVWAKNVIVIAVAVIKIFVVVNAVVSKKIVVADV